jgi:hypothetical protein
MPMNEQFLYIQLKFTQKIRTAAMPMPRQREVVIEAQGISFNPSSRTWRMIFQEKR